MDDGGNMATRIGGGGGCESKKEGKDQKFIFKSISVAISRWQI